MTPFNWMIVGAIVGFLFANFVAPFIGLHLVAWQGVAIVVACGAAGGYGIPAVLDYNNRTGTPA